MKKKFWSTVIKGYIRIILNLKYSYLKIKMPEQTYTFPFCTHLVTQTLRAAPVLLQPALPKAAGTRRSDEGS